MSGSVFPTHTLFWAAEKALSSDIPMVLLDEGMEAVLCPLVMMITRPGVPPAIPDMYAGPVWSSYVRINLVAPPMAISSNSVKLGEVPTMLLLWLRVKTFGTCPGGGGESSPSGPWVPAPV